MKLVVNWCHGEFSLNEEAAASIGVDPFEDPSVLRAMPEVIALVEQDRKAASGRFANLHVISLPDDITDYLIADYDGEETVYYVQDGKIHDI